MPSRPRCLSPPDSNAFQLQQGFWAIRSFARRTHQGEEHQVVLQMCPIPLAKCKTKPEAPRATGSNGQDIPPRQWLWGDLLASVQANTSVGVFKLWKIMKVFNAKVHAPRSDQKAERPTRDSAYLGRQKESSYLAIFILFPVERLHFSHVLAIPFLKCALLWIPTTCLFVGVASRQCFEASQDVCSTLPPSFMWFLH